MKNKSMFGYQFIRIVAGPFFRFLYHVRRINYHVIPKDGPIILCGNHLNFKDQFPVAISTKRAIRWMSKKEYFDGKFAWFFKFVGCISVDRENHGGDSLEIATQHLQDGGAIGIFPEGTRNKTDAELLPFKIGTVYMAQKTKATIVPFAVTGDYKLFSKNTVVRFGVPFQVKEDDDLEKVNESLYQQVLEMQRLNYKETKYERIIS